MSEQSEDKSDDLGECLNRINRLVAKINTNVKKIGGHGQEVEVIIWPASDGARIVTPHAALRIGDLLFGYYPKGGAKVVDACVAIERPGILLVHTLKEAKARYANEKIFVLSLSIDTKQLMQIITFYLTKVRSPGKFQLLEASCAGTVRDALVAGGFDLTQKIVIPYLIYLQNPNYNPFGTAGFILKDIISSKHDSIFCFEATMSAAAIDTPFQLYNILKKKKLVQYEETTRVK